MSLAWGVPRGVSCCNSSAYSVSLSPWESELGSRQLATRGPTSSRWLELSSETDVAVGFCYLIMGLGSAGVECDQDAGLVEFLA